MFISRLYGDYESLQDGKTADAMVDFTGGVAEKLDLAKLDIRSEENKLKLFGKMKEAVDNKSLVNCNIMVGMTRVSFFVNLIILYVSFGIMISFRNLLESAR